MSIMLYLFQAWMIGVAVAAPVGPIGLLCIRKTLELGLRGAILVGLGAALADSCYGLIAALGLSAISHFLLQKAIIIKIIGGLFLLYLSYKEVKSINPSVAALAKSKTSVKLVSEIFFLTLTNPMTILSFIGIFASISGEATTAIESLSMVLGIFLGSMTWWLILGGIIIKIKHKLSETWLHRIKYLSAFILAGFGIFAVVGGLRLSVV
jgi:putative LysE/RhtB family amino acid efflux pump